MAGSPTPGIVAAIQSIVAQQCLGSQAWVVASIPRLKGQYRSLTDWSIVPQGSGRTQDRVLVSITLPIQ